MASRKKIATNWLGNYELMSGNDLPKNLAVLKHYMYLSTFKYSSNTNAMDRSLVKKYMIQGGDWSGKTWKSGKSQGK